MSEGMGGRACGVQLEIEGQNPSAKDTHAGQYRQEIRFAVVMYGGVSLAIYIHGVAQELLRLTRATSVPESELEDDPVALIYRRMSSAVRNQDPRHSKEHCPTRFVIDILSGTSAGGINAIFLAKALAIGSRNLENLRQTWLNVADMEQLLNTGGGFEPKRSLLKGDWMYQQLKKAFEAMNDEHIRDLEHCDKPERLDLFVTTTDLNGATVPIRLADMDVLEKVHKGCFNFRFDNVPLTSAALDQELSTAELARDDFQPHLDPMLAFAARCTSSFPVAFAPMKLVDIRPEVGKDSYARNKESYESFFRWVPPPDLYAQSCADLDLRELADGGYLDNKPFGHAIDAMTFRTSRLPHSRKLFYVDPFPEVAADEGCHAHFDFLQNGLAAATTLPRYQTIREEIARVEFSNLTQERLIELRQRVNQSLSVSRGGVNNAEDFRKTLNETIVEGDAKKTPGAFEQTKVSELIRRFSSQYATYHQVRLMDVTSDLARIVSATHETTQSQDFFLAIRYLVRAWRENNYQPDGEDGKPLETQFFTEFDYSFRLRRAARLLEWSQRHLPTACESLIVHLTRLQRMRERMSLPKADLNPVWKEIGKASDLNWGNVKAILEPVTDVARHAKALQLYKQHEQSLNGIAAVIKTEWKRVFDLNRMELKEYLDAHHVLKEEYKLFDFDDMTSLAFLEGSDVSEHTKTEIYRISPVDGIQRKLSEKLAGYTLMDFGAFLKKDWRMNDMLWGRLDASERIVSAVLNDPSDQACKDGFVKTLREAIIREEASRWSRLVPAVSAIKDGNLVQYLTDKYEMPEPPPRAQSASQIAKATDILGRMVEEDVGVKNGISQNVRTLARIAIGVISLIVPRSLGRVFLSHWLVLLGVMSVINIIIGRLAGKSEVDRFGWIGLASVLLVTALASILGNYLANKLPGYVIRLLKWIPALLVTVLVLIGCYHFFDDWKTLLGRIR